MNPSPGYTMNLIITNARTMFTIQLHTLSSSHIKCHAFFRNALVSGFITKILYTLNKKLLIMRDDYFEGILQLRDIDEEVVDFVKRQTAKRNDVRISRIAKVRNGLDMYFTSQKYLRALGKKLQEHFKGEMVMSPQLRSEERRVGKE